MTHDPFRAELQAEIAREVERKRGEAAREPIPLWTPRSPPRRRTVLDPPWDWRREGWKLAVFLVFIVGLTWAQVAAMFGQL